MAERTAQGRSPTAVQVIRRQGIQAIARTRTREEAEDRVEGIDTEIWRELRP